MLYKAGDRIELIAIPNCIDAEKQAFANESSFLKNQRDIKVFYTTIYVSVPKPNIIRPIIK